MMSVTEDRSGCKMLIFDKQVRLTETPVRPVSHQYQSCSCLLSPDHAALRQSWRQHYISQLSPHHGSSPQNWGKKYSRINQSELDWNIWINAGEGKIQNYWRSQSDQHTHNPPTTVTMNHGCNIHPKKGFWGRIKSLEARIYTYMTVTDSEGSQIFLFISDQLQCSLSGSPQWLW